MEENNNNEFVNNFLKKLMEQHLQSRTSTSDKPIMITFKSDDNVDEENRWMEFVYPNDISQEEKIKANERLLITHLEEEDYEKCAVLRDKINHMKSVSKQVQLLEEQKLQAIKKELYEEANVIKNQIKELNTLP